MPKISVIKKWFLFNKICKSFPLTDQISNIQQDSLTGDMHIFEVLDLKIVLTVYFGENSLPECVEVWQAIIYETAELLVLLLDCRLRIDS